MLSDAHTATVYSESILTVSSSNRQFARTSAATKPFMPKKNGSEIIPTSRKCWTNAIPASKSSSFILAYKAGSAVSISVAKGVQKAFSGVAV